MAAVKGSAQTPERYLASLPAARREEAREVFEFIKRALPEFEPFVEKGLVCFGTFEREAGDRGPVRPRVGMAVNKASICVFTCAGDEKGMYAEQYAGELGKVSVGVSCIRFKSWSDVERKALRKVLRLSAKGPFGFSARRERRTPRRRSPQAR